MYLVHCHLCLCHPCPHPTHSGCCCGHCCSRSCCHHIVGTAVGVVVVVVVVIWMSLPFSVCLGDAASAEPCQYLFSDLAYQTSTYGSVAEHVLYCQCYCDCNGLHSESPHRVHRDSIGSMDVPPHRLHRVFMESSWSPHRELEDRKM
jgi:hypothetical protein